MPGTRALTLVFGLQSRLRARALSHGVLRFCAALSPRAVLARILAEGAIALSVTLSGGALFAS